MLDFYMLRQTQLGDGPKGIAGMSWTRKEPSSKLNMDGLKQSCSTHCSPQIRKYLFSPHFIRDEHHQSVNILSHEFKFRDIFTSNQCNRNFALSQIRVSKAQYYKAQPNTKAQRWIPRGTLTVVVKRITFLHFRESTSCSATRLCLSRLPVFLPPLIFW